MTDPWSYRPCWHRQQISQEVGSLGCWQGYTLNTALLLQHIPLEEIIIKISWLLKKTMPKTKYLTNSCVSNQTTIDCKLMQIQGVKKWKTTRVVACRLLTSTFGGFSPLHTDNGTGTAAIKAANIWGLPHTRQLSYTRIHTDYSSLQGITNNLGNMSITEAELREVIVWLF